MAKGLAGLRPDRLTWGRRRELPVKDWYMLACYDGPIERNSRHKKCSAGEGASRVEGDGKATMRTKHQQQQLIDDGCRSHSLESGAFRSSRQQYPAGDDPRMANHVHQPFYRRSDRRPGCPLEETTRPERGEVRDSDLEHSRTPVCSSTMPHFPLRHRHPLQHCASNGRPSGYPGEASLES